MDLDDKWQNCLVKMVVQKQFSSHLILIAYALFTDNDDIFLLEDYHTITTYAPENPEMWIFLIKKKKVIFESKITN